MEWDQAVDAVDDIVSQVSLFALNWHGAYKCVYLQLGWNMFLSVF